MRRLKGKVAIITGGTSGIGKEIVDLFSKEGATVYFFARDTEKGKKLEEHLRLCNRNVYFLKCDVSNIKDIYKARKIVNRYFEKIDILVNCAGIWKTALLDDIKYEDFNSVYRVNVASVIFMTQQFIDMVIKARGTIINVASIGGMQSNIAGRSQYLYASSKASVIQFSQLCALNYAKSIRVNCICPGPTDTPIYVNKDFSWVKDQIPMGRLGNPQETARAALFLASNDSSYINGAVLTVDGGASIR